MKQDVEPNGDSTAFRTVYAPELAQYVATCGAWRVVPSLSDVARIDGPDRDSAARAPELCKALNRVYAELDARDDERAEAAWRANNPS